MLRDRHIRRRLLRIEPLECRALMSADGLSSFISPIWFQDCSTTNQPSHAGVATWSAESIIHSTSTNSGSVDGQANVYDWIVQFDTNALDGITQLAQTASLLAGGGINFQIIRGLGLEGQELVRSMGSSFDAVEQWFSHDAYVSSFEQDALRQVEKVSNDPLVSQLWGMTKIDAQDAWNITTGASGANRVVVAVIDTGVDYTHPDLAANIWTNTAEIAGNGTDDDHDGFVDDVHGYNFVSNNGNPMDDNGHGTHVSGTIAAVGNNSLGVAGVNWSASIMPLKFMSSTGSGYLSDAVRAINYATMERTQHGVNVRVINASWGGGGFSSAMQTAIQAASDAGIMFVAAAGNSAANNDAAAQYPANYTAPNVISVAASDQNDLLASFSCYGAATVDLAAPGVSIYSTVPNNRYAYYSGTSMATPMVSGVAALAWAYKPNATLADIRNAILQGVDHIGSLSGKVASGGRLDAYNTLKLLGAGAAPSLPILGSLLVSPSSTVAKGASVTLVAQATASSTGVSAVYFYQDTNGNGAYDTGDSCIGYDNTVVNGTAELAVHTGGMTPGTSRFFARAIDKNGQWSTALSTTLTIVAPDDYGNNAAAAAAIAVNSTTAGTIETGGDQDWFKFQAVAGKKYVISTTLVGLTDSVLALYDRNGTTQLAYNDDIASNNPASRIQWTAPASGTYFIKTTAYDTHQTGGYKLSLTSQNSPPVLQSISDQILSNKAGGIAIPLAVSDADGDRLTLSATAYTVDPKTQAHISVPGNKAALTLSGNQLRITRDANFIGVFYVNVTASDGANTVLKSFKVTATNATQQWLVPSSISSLSIGEDLSQGATLARPATAAVPAAPAVNRQVAGGNGFSQACSNYIIYPGMQDNILSLLHTDISAQAVEVAFHESSIQGKSWMPDGTAHINNLSWGPISRGDRILDVNINSVTRNIAHTPGENAAVMSSVPEAGFSKGLEEALESWDNQTSENRSFDEFFAAL